MNITNGVITITPADIASLPADFLTALSEYNQGQSADQALSAAVNEFVVIAHSAWVSRKVDSVKAAVTTAPEATRTQVYDLIEEAKDVLNIP